MILPMKKSCHRIKNQYALTGKWILFQAVSLVNNSDYYAGCGLITGLPNFKYGRITAVIFVRPKNSFVSATAMANNCGVKTLLRVIKKITAVILS